ncbi:MAG: hypothetical protein JWL70_2460 [Acidimicrobiia bacterium]|nr:hypothetical protein [Acidimicrobiia bacterium]
MLALLTLAFGTLVACGDDGGSKASTTTASNNTAGGAATPGTASAAAGCGDRAKADLDVDPATPVARCDPGSPPPQKLAQRATIKLGVSSKSAEFLSPIELGEARGEFEAENLAIDYKILPPADLVQLLASGQIDAVAGGHSAGMFNAMGQGFKVKWVMGQGYNPESSGAGVWVRGANAKAADLKGKKVGSAVGIGSVVNLAFSQALESAGLKLSDVKFQTLPVADIVTALQNGAIDAAILLDPFWLPLKNDPQYTKLAPTIPYGNNIGGIFFGPSLASKRDVGLAFTRAYIRSVSTYFDGDYKAKPEVLTDLAKALATPADKLKQVPSFVFDFDVKTPTSEQLQKLFLDAKALDYQTVLPDSQVVDRSYVAEATGKPR